MPCVICGAGDRFLCEQCSSTIVPIHYSKANPGDSVIERFNAVFGENQSIENATQFNNYLSLLNVPVTIAGVHVLLTAGDIKVINTFIENFKKEFSVSGSVENTEFLLRLAVLYCFVEQNPVSASAVSRIALSIEPENIKGTIVHGFAAFLSGHVTQASELFDRVLTREPGNAEAWYGKALVMKSAGRWGAAIQFLNEVLKINDKFYSAYIEKAKILYNQKRYEEADRTVDAAIRVQPLAGDAWALKAQILNDTGKWGGAYQCLNQAISLEPSNRTYVIEKIKLLIAHGKKDDARALISELSQVEKSDELNQLMKECE